MDGRFERIVQNGIHWRSDSQRRGLRDVDDAMIIRDTSEWNGMEWNGLEWNGMNGMEWNGMEWNGMEWKTNRNTEWIQGMKEHEGRSAWLGPIEWNGKWKPTEWTGRNGSKEWQPNEMAGRNGNQPEYRPERNTEQWTTSWTTAAGALADSYLSADDYLGPDIAPVPAAGRRRGGTVGETRAVIDQGLRPRQGGQAAVDPRRLDLPQESDTGPMAATAAAVHGQAPGRPAAQPRLRRPAARDFDALPAAGAPADAARHGAGQRCAQPRRRVILRDVEGEGEPHGGRHRRHHAGVHRHIAAKRRLASVKRGNGPGPSTRVAMPETGRWSRRRLA